MPNAAVENNEQISEFMILVYILCAQPRQGERTGGEERESQREAKCWGKAF